MKATVAKPRTRGWIGARQDGALFGTRVGVFGQPRGLVCGNHEGSVSNLRIPPSRLHKQLQEQAAKERVDGKHRWAHLGELMAQGGGKAKGGGRECPLVACGASWHEKQRRALEGPREGSDLSSTEDKHQGGPQSIAARRSGIVEPRICEGSVDGEVACFPNQATSEQVRTISPTELARA